MSGLVGLVGLLAASASASAAAAQDVEASCTDTVVAYADHWDHADAAGFTTLFSEDATLTLGANPVVGRPAIEALFARRASAATTRHLMTNIDIQSISPTAATGRSYVMLFSGPAGSAGGGPVEAEGYTLVGEYHDRFEISEGICRFSERRLVTIFRRPRPPQP